MALKVAGTTVVNDSRQITDLYGDVRDIPRIGLAKSTAYTLQTSDVGQLIVLTTGGSVVIPDAVFIGGNAISIVNNTSAAITITCNITSAYVSGVFTDRATVSLKAAGLMTVVFLSSTVCIMTGAII